MVWSVQPAEKTYGLGFEPCGSPSCCFLVYRFALLLLADMVRAFFQVFADTVAAAAYWNPIPHSAVKVTAEHKPKPKPRSIMWDICENVKASIPRSMVRT